MASVAKFKLNDTPRLLSHCSRTQKNQGSHIHKERTNLNFNLAEEKHPECSDYQFVKKTISQDNVKMLKRDDVNAVCSWAITLPKELCHEVTDSDGNEYFVPNDDIECKDFFQNAYDFFKQKHGEKNIVSAYVHMDENMPHMHFIFMPIVKEKNGPGFKVCAKEALSDCYGAKFQIELQDYISRHMGKELHMVRKETVDYERNVKELKKKTLNQRCAYLAKAINKTEEQLVRKRAVLEALSKSAENMQDIQVKTTSSNGLTVMKNQDWEYIQEQLRLINRLKSERREIIKMLKDFEKNNNAVENENLSHEVERLARDNMELSSELQHIHNFMDNMQIDGITMTELYKRSIEHQQEERY